MSYIWLLVCVAAVAGALAPFHDCVNPTTVALALLLAVLFAATLWGSRPALVAAMVAALAFNYFFLPPLYTFTISVPGNWVALATFLITAVTVGELSARSPPRRGGRSRTARDRARPLSCTAPTRW